MNAEYLKCDSSKLVFCLWMKVYPWVLFWSEGENGNGCIQRSLKRPLGKGGTHFTQPLHNIFIKTRISIMNYNVPLTLHKIKSKCFGKNWSAYIQCYSRKITLLGDQTAFQRTRYLKLKWKNAPIWNSLW